MGLRVTLAGRVGVEVDGRPVEVAGLGRLGRLVLAYLVTEVRRPVAREELAEALWGEALPASWETSLRVLVSKVRTVLAGAGLPARDALVAENGCYRLHLPPGTAVDTAEAAARLAEAEAALAAGEPDRARHGAAAAAEVAARPFLQDVSGAWVDRRQDDLRQLRVRALEVLAEASSAAGAGTAAVAAAEEAVALAPLRESAHLRLIAAHAAAGNRAEALRAYERCRRRLAEELGMPPSAAVEAAYVGLLRQDDEPPAPARPPVAGAGRRETGERTTFVGRERETQEVVALVGGGRLVTLTGTGGVGKTRLALRAAAGLRPAFAGRVHVVELAPLVDGALLAQHVLDALGLADEPGRAPAATLAAHLDPPATVLVLDNCEHVVAACATLVEELLDSCPGLRVLATSREPLGVAGETTWRVPSLAVPGPGALPPLDQLAGIESVRLFVDRATAADTGFELTEVNAPAVAQVCRGLDGIPLALELAAARTRVLTVDDIARRLDDRLRLLAGGPRSAPARHRTLQAAVDWSYEALSPREAALFARLSVFAGSFPLGAAEEVGAGGDLEAGDVLELLPTLVERSMVVADTGAAATRFRLLETLRAYAAERLAEAPAELVAAQDRHLAWAAVVAEEAAGRLLGPDQAAALERLDAEHDELRAALSWGTAGPVRADALRLAAALSRFWELRGHLREGRGWLRAALADGTGAPPGLRARALNGAAVLAQRQGDHADARALYQEVLVICRGTGDRLGTAAALHGLGNLATLEGDLAAATVLYEDSLAIGRRLGDGNVVAASLANLGSLAHTRGDVGAAWSLYEESLAVRRRLGDRHGIATLTAGQGYMAFQQGDYERARALYGESLALQRQLGDRPGIAGTLCNLGYLALAEGDLRGAATRLEEALAEAEELGDRHAETLALLRLAKVARAGGDGARAADLDRRALALTSALGARRAVAEALEGAAEAAVSDGDHRRAARLLGAAAGLRDAVGAPVPSFERAGHDRRVAAVRAALGDDAFAGALADGGSLTLEEAVRQAAAG